MKISVARHSPLQDWSTPALTAVDFSLYPRWGCKGAAAAAWLQSAELPLPEHANTWSANAAITTYRLGRNEFLLEGPEAVLQGLRQAAKPAGVYSVWREGAALLLQGSGLPRVLRQICSIDFSAYPLDARPVILTNMIGVSVIAVPGPDSHALRLWFDASYAHYFQHTLRSIAEEL